MSFWLKYKRLWLLPGIQNSSKLIKILQKCHFEWKCQRFWAPKAFLDGAGGAFGWRRRRLEWRRRRFWMAPKALTIQPLRGGARLEDQSII